MEKVIAGSIAFAISMSALAQEAGWYVGGSIGQTRVDVDTANLASDLNALGFGHTGVSPDESDTGWKAFAGYRVNRNFAIEGGVVSLGEISARATIVSVGGVPVIPGSITVTAETDPGFFASALGIVPLGERAQVYGKLGFYSIKTEGTLTASGSGGTASFSSSDRTSDLLFGLGFGYDFTRNIGVRAEWERFRKVGDEDSTGKGDVDLLSVGLVYRFR